LASAPPCSLWEQRGRPGSSGSFPPLLHGYADITVTVALIVLPFVVGFQGHTTALVFYLIVGAGGLGASLATRFEARMPAEREMMVRMAA
jgi:hypothetical protein